MAWPAWPAFTAMDLAFGSRNNFADLSYRSRSVALIVLIVINVAVWAAVVGVIVGVIRRLTRAARRRVASERR